MDQDQAQRQVAELASLPRFALTREQAAASLSMSLDTFERYVQPELRMVRRWGRHIYVPLAELERVAIDAAERTLP